MVFIGTFFENKNNTATLFDFYAVFVNKFFF